MELMTDLFEPEDQLDAGGVVGVVADGPCIYVVDRWCIASVFYPISRQNTLRVSYDLWWVMHRCRDSGYEMRAYYTYWFFSLIEIMFSSTPHIIFLLLMKVPAAILTVSLLFFSQLLGNSKKNSGYRGRTDEQDSEEEWKYHCRNRRRGVQQASVILRRRQLWESDVRTLACIPLQA